MQCPKCGYNNPDDALFCNLCHAIFRKESVPRPDISQEEERYVIMHRHHQRGGWKRWLGLDVWASIIVIIGVAVWATNTMMTKQQRTFVENKGSEKTVESGITSEFIPAGTQSQLSLLNKIETTHFVIYCNDKILAEDIAARVEGYYDIPTDLGFGEANFWMKEKVQIYVYDTPQEYAKATGRAHLTSGYSEFKTRTIYSHKYIEHLIDAVIPHELTHLIFADFMKFSPNYPAWLSEGLAMYEEVKFCQAYNENYKNILNQIKEGKYISVDNLTRIDISKEQKIEVVQFWYVESMSLVTYLIDNYGRGKLYSFCKNLREGMGLEEALQDAYSPHIKNLPELTGRWLNYIKTKAE
ncbi:MAG: peptidase MA family metallohydrolase [bacterium]|nr:peptidase MA family metallohydrolase [bacterium]